MNLQSQLTALQEQTRGLAPVERAKLCCGLAKQFEKAGEYEAACEALAEFWPERHGPPTLGGLDQATTAEVLLRVGALAGWSGSADQTEGSQETAKDLITRSVEIFEGLGQSEHVAEARTDLALCYWREGGFDEARIHLAGALSLLKNKESDLKACVLIRAGMVEVWARQLNEALRFYNEAAVSLEQSTDDAIKGSLHNQLALLYRKLGTPELHDEYTDRALIEYAAASFHFEQAGNERYLARVENNLGFLFFTIGRYKDAHQHLDRARQLFLELKDAGTVAQVDDTRARTLLAEGRTVEAERFARQAVRTLEKGGEQALLAEALTTHGTALARLGNYTRSKGLLQRAIEVAETAGDPEGSGRAKLSIVEELGEQTSARELASIYESAVDLLESSQDPSAKKRLVSCARTVIDALTSAEDEQDSAAKEQSWDGFSFKQEVLRIERALIERALRDAGGSVTRAARLLGFGHHQSLIALINTRHQNLLNTRSAIRKRRRHIFSKPKKTRTKVVKPGAVRAALQISILHVEDNKVVARLIQDTLGAEGMHVDSCLSGPTALEILRSDAAYDVIIVDNDLPGLNGLELVLRTKSMAHRRHTPIIMLSGNNCEKEAWRAGVDAFLRKPEAVDQLSSTIARVLEEKRRRKD